MNEEWRAVPNTNGLNEVSSHGRVRALTRTITYKDGRSFEKPGGVLSAKPKQGYPSVSLVNGRRECIHSLVALAFIGPRPTWARTVNHLDGDKSNNRAENLEWASYADNNRHARITRLNQQDGMNCNLTKFERDVVDAVKILWPTGRFTREELGALFGMSAQHVYEIVSGKSRKLG